jgi:hypothetical protein
MRRYCCLVVAFIFVVLDFSCTNMKEANPLATGQLYFHLHTNIDNTEVPGYDSIVSSSSGRKISLDFTQMYISNIRLVRSDGSLYSVANKVLLKTFWNELYLIGNVPAETYKSVQFTVGFDSITGAKIPISSDTVFNHPEMWFWTTAQPQGYIFLNVQGMIDTSTNADGLKTHMVQFTYKIGTSANAKQISLPDENFSISSNQTQYVHLVINYMKLFEGLDLSKTRNLSVENISDNGNAVAKQIANNVPGMFSYEF